MLVTLSFARASGHAHRMAAVIEFAAEVVGAIFGVARRVAVGARAAGLLAMQGETDAIVQRGADEPLGARPAAARLALAGARG